MTPKVLAGKEYGRCIVDFALLEDNTLVEISELCDSWFGATLTKDEFGQFIAELQVMHAEMVAKP